MITSILNIIIVTITHLSLNIYSVSWRHLWAFCMCMGTRIQPKNTQKGGHFGLYFIKEIHRSRRESSKRTSESKTKTKQG